MELMRFLVLYLKLKLEHVVSKYITKERGGPKSRLLLSLTNLLFDEER